MDIKVNNVNNPAPVDNVPQVQPGTDAFRFALISNIEEFETSLEVEVAEEF